jgi:hypothetical protein
MLHQLLLAGYSQPEAAGFILRGIHGIFVLIGSDQGPQPIRLGHPRIVFQHSDADRCDCDPVQEVVADTADAARSTRCSA